MASVNTHILPDTLYTGGKIERYSERKNISGKFIFFNHTTALSYQL